MKKNFDLNRLKDWVLIVVDMQNDFLAAGGYYARRDDLDLQVASGKISMELRNRIMGQSGVAPPTKFSYRTTSLPAVATKICSVIEHARAKHRPIAYLKAVYSREFVVLPPFLTREPHREHFPCKPNSWGTAIIEPVSRLIDAKPTNLGEKVIEKHTIDGFFQTELLQFIQTKGVQTVVIVGVETHVCVFATAKSSSIHQFNTLILEDCVWTAQDALGLGALAIFREVFGYTSRLQELLDAESHA